jgi:hypothetical protein
MKDYTRETVYIGIDVHKKTYSVTAICNGTIVKRDTIAAHPEQLVNYRTRNQLVDNKKRVGNQLKSLLFTQGLIDPNDDMKVCKTWI